MGIRRRPGRSVPMKITGRAGSTRITLMPAPTGKGLVIGETGSMILEMAGITDVWSSSKGQTRTQYNFAELLSTHSSKQTLQGLAVLM